MKQLLTQDSCLSCLGCCRFSQADSVWSPGLLDREIRGFLKKRIPPSVFKPNKRLRLIPAEDQQSSFVCTFLNTTDNKCKVYDYRPFECQLYPFMINRKGRRVYLALDLKCPFIKQNLKNQDLLAYARYLKNLLSSPSKLKTLKRNPQIIQTYEDVLNLSELNL